MTISIWRYSHLALAVSSFLLLTLASITGIILAFEPITQKVQPYRVENFEHITLAETLPVLRKQYPSISQLSVDVNGFVQMKSSNAQGKNMLVYVDPRNGKVLGEPGKQSSFFQWVTTLHRSLFAHETGRFFVGLTAFLLLLIAVSGTALVLQRQRGLKRFFTQIAKENFAQYYHVVLGRLSLLPIIIIALTGTYLSLNRFNIISGKKGETKVNIDAIKDKPVKKPAYIAFFKNTKLSQVEGIAFPFSDDPEDYYTFKLSDREVVVNQITGDVLDEVKYPTALIMANLSLNIHTGRINGIWAIVLAVASANILFFIYSGFVITWKRIGNRSKNKYKANDSRFIILVGSENGSTFRYANAVHQQLLKQGEKSYLAELNNYKVFPKAEHLLVFTSTYGLGDAPSNAKKFTALLEKHQQGQPVQYSVLGFGSHAYADFCHFAFEVNNQLGNQTWAKPLIDIHTVNDKSPEEFSLWAEAWSQQSGIQLAVMPRLQMADKARLSSFKVTYTSAGRTGDTFLVRLRPKQKLKVTSGDLLAIYPANDHRERLYSIGIIGNELQLSVRLHPEGLGSGFLNRLMVSQIIQARVISNKHFHFPQKATEVIMISNGTGIAPFLGMLAHNRQKINCQLYCGFREYASFEKYQSFLEEQLNALQLNNLQVAFSREDKKQYVSDLLANDADTIARALAAGGVLMLCGSLSMQKDVLELLESICQAKIGQSVSYYQSHNQIRTDCY